MKAAQKFDVYPWFQIHFFRRMVDTGKYLTFHIRSFTHDTMSPAQANNGQAYTAYTGDAGTKTGWLPSIDELAEVLDMEAEEVADILSKKDNTVSLDAPFSGEGEGSLLDTLENTGTVDSDRNILHTESLRTDIGRLLSVLSEDRKKRSAIFMVLVMITR
ncbi:MAG: sigma-70 domain-containing protein [Bacteroidota bacterium]